MGGGGRSLEALRARAGDSGQTNGSSTHVPGNRTRLSYKERRRATNKAIGAREGLR